MADRVISVITPATSYDLVSLDEIKLWFGILPTDTSQDAILNQYISSYSDIIATYCNRTFGYETVSEIWRCTEYDEINAMKRLFTSHYPIDEAAPITLESPSGTILDPSSYLVEWKSGKVEMLQACSEPITVTYAGGYNLPNEAPWALKQAAAFLIREGQALMLRLGVSGIRSISHKDSRVMYFDINQLTGGPKGATGLITSIAGNLLMKYVRFEV